MCSTSSVYNEFVMILFQVSCVSCYLNLTLMRNLRWKRFWIQICTKGVLCDWLSELTLMNLSDINFLISLSVMRLWNTSTIITQINQTRLTDMNNSLIWRTQSFYHKLFLINNHTHSNMTLYVISVCYSAGRLRACAHDLKTHQHIFITLTRFAEPWQGLWNLNKVCETSTRFVKPWQGLQNLDEVYVASTGQYSRFIENGRNSRGRVMSRCDHMTCAQTTD